MYGGWIKMDKEPEKNNELRFYFKEWDIFEDKVQSSIDIVKKFPSWVNNGSTLDTLVQELVYCLLAMGYSPVTIKESLEFTAENM
jgi:hypothetical protein